MGRMLRLARTPALLCIAFASAAACADFPPADRPRPAEAAPPPARPDAHIDRSGWPVIVAFGDSLTAGQGVPPDLNYPSQLQAALDARALKYRVVNAGLAGDTTGGGRSRVDTVLAQNPRIVILELGVNDGLRGHRLDRIRDNLAAIIERLQAKGVQVVLAGMMVPSRFSPHYADGFGKIFPDLAAKYRLALIPFFLQDVALVRDLNQPDGLHPTAEGYSYVVRNVLRIVEPLLRAKD
jgi:acyl-CoA thioesterase I